jgi:hypothetical protein
MADETWLDAEKALALKLTDVIERNAAPAEDAMAEASAAEIPASARAGDAAPDLDGARSPRRDRPLRFARPSSGQPGTEPTAASREDRNLNPFPLENLPWP